ncbi:MAG TPA: CBS domain-containing protein, partial [Chthonomonadales bacterium]|nr:CBS domain-containing protein [Chthonomonadales bacterium]
GCAAFPPHEGSRSARLESVSHRVQTMLVQELMKTHVVKTTPGATLGEAADLMDIYQVSALPVVDESGTLCGMITERDIAGALEPVGLDSARAGDWDSALATLSAAGAKVVGKFMTKPAVSVCENADAREAAIMMLNTGLKRAPVTRSDGVVIGTLNRIDILEALFESAL